MKENFEKIPGPVARRTQIRKIRKESLSVLPRVESGGMRNDEQVRELKSLLSKISQTKSLVFSIAKQEKIFHEKAVTDDLFRLLLKLEDRLSSFVEFNGGHANDKSDLVESALGQLRGEIGSLGRELSTYSISLVLPDAFRKIIFNAAVIGATALSLIGDRTNEPAHSLEGQERLEHARKDSGKDASMQEAETDSTLEELLANQETGGSVAAELSGKGEPGRFEKEKIMAEIAFTTNSAITDPLWVTSYAVLTASGELRVATTEMKFDTGRPEATVALQPLGLRAGSGVSLPVPVGFAASEVSTAPRSDFVSDGKTMFPKEGVSKAKISYTVKAAKLIVDIPEARPAETRTAAYERAVLDIRSGKSEAKVLQDYYGDFTYIVSTDLQKLLAGMPGTMADKVGGIKVGDCDTLSAHGATLLNEAGVKACLATGFLEKEGKLDASRAHAKLMFEKEGGYNLFETTAPVRQSFLNVRFAAEDLQALRAVSEEARNAKTPEELLPLYEKFGGMLREVLANPKYERFRTQSVTAEAVGEGSLSASLVEKLRENFNRFLKQFSSENSEGSGSPGQRMKEHISRSLSDPADLSEFLTFMGIVVAATVGTIGTFIAGVKQKEKLDARVLESAKLTAADLWQNLERGPGRSEGWTTIMREQLADSLDNLYARSPVLKKILPLREVRTWGEDDQAGYVRLLSVASGFAKGDVLEIQHLLGLRGWGRVAARLKADGPNATDNLFSFLADIVARPETTEAMTKAEKEFAEDVWNNTNRWVLDLEMIKQRGGRDLPLSRHASLASHTSTRSRPVEAALRGKTGPSTGGDFSEHFKYRSGDDLRRVDWRASGRRDDILVKQYESDGSAENPDRLRDFAVVIDVVGMEKYEMGAFADLLAEAATPRSPLKIEGVEILAFGRPVETWSKERMRQFATDKNVEVNVKFLIERLLKLRREAAGAQFLQNMQQYYTRVAYRASLLPEITKRCGRGKPLIALGIEESELASAPQNLLTFKPTERTS